MRKYLGMERESSMDAVYDRSYDIICHVQRMSMELIRRPCAHGTTYFWLQTAREREMRSSQAATQGTSGF